MRAKCKKALRASPNSPVTARPVVTPLWRHPELWVSAPNTLVAAVAAILWDSGSAAYAQEQTLPMPASESMETVVVTGTATGAVKKLDASYNIVTVDAEEIKMANPKSTADLLKVSPGIWPESSGGQTGANIEVAGFPSGGDAPFFTNMIEGSPLYGMPSLNFMDSSSLFRLDDTIERVEVVQGGPSAIFGPAQMGAQANFILRRGTAKPQGEVSFTYGNEGLYRLDAFYGFQGTEGWYASVGGFYRGSNGVRPPQFKADQGGQFTVTASHDLDGGSLMFWARTTQDKNQFIIPLPLVESAGGQFSAYPGFNPLSNSFYSKAIQNVVIPNPAGGFEGADLANGRGANLYYLGSVYNQKFGKWSVLNHFLFDGGDLPTNSLLFALNPRPLTYFLYGCHVPQPAGYCNAMNQPVDMNNLPGTNGLGLDPTVYNVAAVYAGSGRVVPENQDVIEQPRVYIQKNLRNITDELRATYELIPGNHLTLGIYWASYMDDDNWSAGNGMLMTTTPNATTINLSYLQGGNTYYLTSPLGIVDSNDNFNFLEHGDATNIAGFVSDSWKIGSWLIDIGARLENIDAHQRTCNTSPQQLGTRYDLWDNAVPICNGTWDYEHYDKTRPTYTGGVNYEFSHFMSAYFRANTGVHFDDFDNNIRYAMSNFAPLETVTNYEVGFKFQASWAYLDISAYKRDFTGLQYQPTNASGVPIGPTATYGSATHGVDFVGVLTPIRALSIRFVGDYMDGTYKDYQGCFPYYDLYGNPQCGQINGSPLQRQPRFQIRVTPQYRYRTQWGDLTAWVTYEYVGQRYEDQTGLQPLGTYDMWSAGIVANLGKRWQYRVQGTNLSNALALTEGNSRFAGVSSGIGGVLLARPIEGREINFTAKYMW